MHFDVRLSGDFRDLTRAELASGKRAVRDAMAQAGTSLKMAWRSEVVAVGLGNRLGNSIRSKVFPASGAGSLRAAALVYTKAPKLIEAHDKGAVIRARNSSFLAIPTPAAGRGPRGARITPEEWQRKTGLKLLLVERPGRVNLLVAEGRINSKGRAVISKSKTGRGLVTAPIFILVKQAKLKKKGDIATLANAATSRLPRMIAANWRDR